MAERAIGVDGPIREYYLVSSADTDDVAKHRTEVCWPVFRTGACDSPLPAVIARGDDCRW